jgi:hypothetical protein
MVAFAATLNGPSRARRHQRDETSRRYAALTRLRPIAAEDATSWAA